MTDVVAGILLPDTVLRSTWFFYLAAFVAFNTIIFVGLSLAKLLLWPQPSIPADVVPQPDADSYLRRRRYGRLTESERERLDELESD